MKTELSGCVIQELNGYDLLRNNLQYNGKTELVPIDIVYEPRLDVSKSILCFFRTRSLYCTPDILWKISWRKQKKGVNSTAAKQCPYCNNFFLKSKEKMKKHISLCTGQAGFNFVFDNGKIFHYQDNYKKTGDLPFSLYFDFETTTGSVVFFDAKNECG